MLTTYSINRPPKILSPFQRPIGFPKIKSSNPHFFPQIVLVTIFTSYIIILIEAQHEDLQKSLLENSDNTQRNQLSPSQATFQFEIIKKYHPLSVK